eukprot:GFYU01009259.1.p1 GENE.GFYU01009259.1~~GFYU01009259.1.p1  ORF type:complete len:340 (-),score=44.53 GFYU01009259.1:467-1486(-)
MDYKTRVLDSARAIAEGSVDAKVESAGVERSAKFILDNLDRNPYSFENWTAHPLNPSEVNDRTIEWIFVVDTWNYSFWNEDDSNPWTVKYKGESYTGYWAMVAAVNRAIDEGTDLTNAAIYKDITREEVAHIFRSETTAQVPMLDQRVESLHSVGKVLVERYGSCFRNVVEQAGGSAGKLLQMIVETIPTYNDIQTIQGKEVYFYKRAQILIADVWACYAGKGLGRFDDIDVITMFADYRVPQMLRHIEAISYSPHMNEVLSSQKEMASGDRLEMEIRGCSIWSVELIRQKLASLMEERGLAGSSMNSIMLDFFLWDYAKEHQGEMRHIPIHRIRSIFY